MIVIMASRVCRWGGAAKAQVGECWGVDWWRRRVMRWWWTLAVVVEEDEYEML